MTASSFLVAVHKAVRKKSNKFFPKKTPSRQKTPTGNCQNLAGHAVGFRGGEVDRFSRHLSPPNSTQSRMACLGQ